MANFDVIIPCLLLVIVNFQQIYADDCKFTKPINSEQIAINSEIFCKTLSDTNNYDVCVNKIKHYFAEIDENQNTIKKYVDTCSTISAVECAGMTITLKGYCYNMERMVELSNVVPNLYLHIFPEKSVIPVGKFDLNYLVWKEYDGNVEIAKCLGHIDETLKLLNNHYKKWVQEQNGKGDCNCVEITGLQELFYGFGVPQDPKKTIYNDFCYNNSGKKREHVWSLKQLKEITQAKGLTYVTKKIFIKSAISIGKAGWLMKPATEWSVEFIHNYLLRKDLEPNLNYEDRVDLIAAAIKAEFSQNDFTDFILKTHVEGFKEAKCRESILNNIFNSKSNGKQFWKENTKTVFNLNLQILIKIFKESYPNENCSSFVERLTKLQEDIVKTDINCSKLSSILKQALDSKIKFDDIRTRLH